MKKSRLFLFLIITFTYNQLSCMFDIYREEIITLQSSDGAYYEIDKNIASLSPFIKSLIESKADKVYDYKIERNHQDIIHVDLPGELIVFVLTMQSYINQGLDVDIKCNCENHFKCLQDIKNIYAALERLQIHNPQIDKFVILFLSNFFKTKKKKGIEAFLHGMPESVATNLAKSFFYQFGQIEPNQSDKKRNTQFLNIISHYDFSLQELIDNKKISGVHVNKHKFILKLNSLKLRDLVGLSSIPNIEVVEKLYLNNNCLTKISPDSFSKLLNLCKLNLHNNPIAELPDIFQGHNYKKLKFIKHDDYCDVENCDIKNFLNNQAGQDNANLDSEHEIKY